ncbi:hypothetical protein EEJ42_15740 [Streptomyces botrytidirepellens]|uniref:Uncharacterized protein n=1 Tax=Streptomyces botrytidirepellens TaxID=2486417 RepID=A0A3M8WBZ3_9ACTN|nr:hypothetical protein EEJ42_15740 [Streptomyces botrytidirepellens]
MACDTACTSDVPGIENAGRRPNGGEIDGVLVLAHSEKQDAAAIWKKTFGNDPLMRFVGRRQGGSGELVVGLLPKWRWHPRVRRLARAVLSPSLQRESVCRLSCPVLAFFPCARTQTARLAFAARREGHCRPPATHLHQGDRDWPQDSMPLGAPTNLRPPLPASAARGWIGRRQQAAASGQVGDA